MINSRQELFGESIFTSFRTVDGKVFGFQEHIDRLWHSAKVYYALNHVSRGQFKEYYLGNLNLVNSFKLYPNSYFRLTLHCVGPVQLDQKYFGLSDLVLDLHQKVISSDLMAVTKPQGLKTQQSPFTEHCVPIKNSSYFQSLYFRRQAVLNGFNDVLFLRAQDVLECSTSALVFVRENKFIFPKNKGIIESISTKNLMQFLQASNCEFESRVIKIGELKTFTFAYSLNSVSFLTRIKNIDNIFFKLDNLDNLKYDFVNFAKENLS